MKPKHRPTFKKGDLLTTSHSGGQPIARVTEVTRDGVVHCVNLIASGCIDVGAEFTFVPDEWTRYYPLPKG